MSQYYKNADAHIPSRRPLSKAGMGFELSNKSKLASSPECNAVCPICFIAFRRAASHLARVGTAYCSTACRIEGRKVRIETHCVVCAVSMEQTPSDAVRVRTCSKKCSSIRRRVEGQSRNNRSRFRGSPEVKMALSKVMAASKCAWCGADQGPWVVRGLVVSLLDDMPSADDNVAYLLCRCCHLADNNDNLKKAAEGHAYEQSST